MQVPVRAVPTRPRWRVALLVPVVALGVGLAPSRADDGAGEGAGEEWSWQNPGLSANPFNNIHNDSWFTDTYTQPGPTTFESFRVEILADFTFDDPLTGEPTSVRIGECPAHTYDGEGNLLTVGSGFPDPIEQVFQRSILSISPSGELLAYAPFTTAFTDIQEAITEFGGIGYFFLDQDERIVMGMPNGHIVAWERQDSPLSEVDAWVPVRDVNITGEGGPVPSNKGSLYALVPAENGFLWFTTRNGAVGTVSPADAVQWLDVNDPGAPGNGPLTLEQRRQTITESHSVNGNTTYQQSDHFMYRFDMDGLGAPRITWREIYDRGLRTKSGQTSRGSGTSPAFFEMGGREFVTIMDNATRPKINVYRADELLPGEQRVLASIPWLGDQLRVSDENSLIVYPGTTPDGRRIFAENNWGNDRFTSTAGPRLTRPGFGGIEVRADGTAFALEPNLDIRVPSVVSKGNIPSNAVYTYEKRRDGWYLTALDPSDLDTIVWTGRVGSGAPRYNVWYAQLSLAPDGNTFHVGVSVGVLRVRASEAPALPSACVTVGDALDYLDTMEAIATWRGGPTFFADYLQAGFTAWDFEFHQLDEVVEGPAEERLLAVFLRGFLRSHQILRRAAYQVELLSPDQQAELREIVARQQSFGAVLEAYAQANCAPDPGR